MATVASPFGLLARWHPSGQTRSNAYENVLLSLYAANIYYGTPVKLAYTTAGATNQGAVTGANQVVLEPVAATTDAVLGSFAGVEYTDVNGRRQYSKFWASGQSIQAGTQTIAYVFDDPENIYEIQCDAALNTGSNTFQFYGRHLNFTAADLSATVPAGNASPVGQSSCRANATLVASGSSGQLEIVSSFGLSSSTTAMGDAFPTQYVKIAKHQLRPAITQIATGY